MKSWVILSLFVLLTGSFLLMSCGGGGQYDKPTPTPPVKEPVVVEPEPEPEPVPEPVEEVIVPNTIYFDFDRSDIRMDQRAPLADNAGMIEEKVDAYVTIEGHCDERGTNEYNMALGQRRADSVKRYLINYGIDPSRLTTISYGEERPADPGHDEAAWARNRRAEFVIQQ